MVLSLKFGIPVWVLQATWTSAQFALYAAYDRIQPITEEREDARFAMLLCFVANALPRKRQRTFRPSDFMGDKLARALRVMEQEAKNEQARESRAARAVSVIRTHFRLLANNPTAKGGARGNDR